jgi:hypothetical protein
MRLYRGIAVPAETASQTIKEIRDNGLVAGKGRWAMIAADLKPRLNDLWKRSALTASDVEAGETTTWVCACADQEGALYYALKHNRSNVNDTPLLISFEAELDDIIVDGRDFLFTLFQLGHPPKARPIAERLFGPAVLRYVDRAWQTDGQQQRIALCKLAVQDDAVIAAHATNQTVIGGRWGTRFCSAFLVRAPVDPPKIADVSPVGIDLDLPAVEISLDMIR